MLGTLLAVATSSPAAKIFSLPRVKTKWTGQTTNEPNDPNTENFSFESFDSFVVQPSIRESRNLDALGLALAAFAFLAAGVAVAGKVGMRRALKIGLFFQ